MTMNIHEAFAAIDECQSMTPLTELAKSNAKLVVAALQSIHLPIKIGVTQLEGTAGIILYYLNGEARFDCMNSGFIAFTHPTFVSSMKSYEPARILQCGMFMRALAPSVPSVEQIRKAAKRRINNDVVVAYARVARVWLVSLVNSNFDANNDEIRKACPILSNDDILHLDNGIVYEFETEELARTAYDYVVGDDGPTKLNPYTGPAKVYALLVGPEGAVNENT